MSQSLQPAWPPSSGAPSAEWGHQFVNTSTAPILANDRLTNATYGRGCYSTFCLMLDKTHLSSKKKTAGLVLSTGTGTVKKNEGELCQLLFKSPRNMQELWANVSKHQVDGAQAATSERRLVFQWPRGVWICNSAKNVCSSIEPFLSLLRQFK